MAEINIHNSINGNGLDFECPNCGNEIELGQNYCHECGEAIEWRDDNDG